MSDPSQTARERLLSAGHTKDTTRRLAWGLLIGAVVLETMLGLALFDYWLVLPPAFRVAGGGLLLLLLVAGTGGWLRLRHRPATMKEAALDAESQRPEIGCVVSTAAEYLSGERKITHEYEPELVSALETQAARHLQKVQVPYQNRLLRPAGFFAFALLTLLVFAAVAPVALTALKRTVAPWSKETYTRVEVRPGSVEVPVGLDVAVTNLFSGRPPKNPALHWRETNQAAWQVAALARSEDGTYPHLFKSVQQPIEYRVTGNDATSERYEITPYVPPEVRELRINVVYPAYTGVKPYAVEKPDLTVLRGSELTFRIGASTALATARLRFTNLPPVELARAQDDLWRGRLVATKEADYWIELADAKGHRGGNEKPYHLRVLPDNPPKVDIIEPGQDIRADPTNTVPLRIAASDDFEVTAVKVVYHKLGGPEQAITCVLTNGDGDEVLASAGLPLAPLDLKPYEVVAYHAEAIDNNTLDGPGKGASPVYFIEVTHDEEGGQQAKSQSKGQKVNLLAIQKQVIADTAATAPKAAAGKYNELSARQKEAAELSQLYQDALRGSDAPEEASRLMEDATTEMKNASRALAGRERDKAIPSEEKALADLYQVLKLVPELQNMPTQPPPSEEEQAQQSPKVKVVLEAIKKQKKEQPSNAEMAKALETARQLSQAQAALNDAMRQPGQAAEASSPDAPAAGAEGKPEGDQAGQQAEAQQAGDQQGDAQASQAAAKAGQGKEGQQAKAGSKPGEGKQGEEAKAGSKEGEGKGKAEAGTKPGEGKEGQQANAEGQGGEGKEGQDGKAGSKGKQGQENQKAGAKPGEANGDEDAAKLAEMEAQLSQEAAALAEKLQKLAGKDGRLGQNAGQKMTQASGQMAGAAGALRQGKVAVAGTEGAQGLANVNKVVALLERILKDDPKLTDAAAEDYPKEYERLISEYLRRLSHEK